MSAQYPQPTAHRILIPEIFHSDATGEPLSHCVLCEMEVYRSEKKYHIEKAIRYNRKFDMKDTLFEYAICSACYDGMVDTLSTDSYLKMLGYFSAHAGQFMKVRTKTNEQPYDVTHQLSTCFIKDINYRDCDEFQICCQCEGADVLLAMPPLMLSDVAMFEINELLSPETKEELDRFREKLNGIPPEWRELLKDRSPLLV